MGCDHKANTDYRSEKLFIICVYELIQQTVLFKHPDKSVMCSTKTKILKCHIHSTEFQSSQRRTRNIRAVFCFMERGQIIYGFGGGGGGGGDWLESLIS
jgi:hypothetical protein